MIYIKHISMPTDKGRRVVEVQEGVIFEFTDPTVKHFEQYQDKFPTHSKEKSLERAGMMRTENMGLIDIIETGDKLESHILDRMLSEPDARQKCVRMRLTRKGINDSLVIYANVKVMPPLRYHKQKGVGRAIEPD